MKSGIYITESSIKELERRANLLIKEVNEAKTSLLARCAGIVRDKVRAYAPRGKTGNLKRAAYAKTLPPTMSYPAVAFAGIRPRTAPHGHLVEFGHEGPHPAPPHPFVQPAWADTKGEVKQILEGGLKKTIEK